jgi:phosphatidylglycerol---prolipoprotein diacylglyceryl transferase
VGQRDRPDGWLLGLFLVLMFSARFLIEFAKTPQAEYEAGFAISVGQILSIPFVLAGLLLIARAHTRRPA